MLKMNVRAVKFLLLAGIVSIAVSSFPIPVSANVGDAECSNDAGASSQTCAVYGEVSSSGDSSEGVDAGGDGDVDAGGESGGEEVGDSDGGTGDVDPSCEPILYRMEGTIQLDICAYVHPSADSYSPVQASVPARSPVEAVRAAMARLQLQAITIGMAPEVNPEWGHRRSYTGVPIWMWVENRSENTWGPLSAELSLGGHQITMTATVDHVDWDMGDGTIVSCGLGTRFHESMGFTTSPDCGHVYKLTSKREPDGFYTVTATSRWHVHWSSSTGQSGIMTTTTTASTPLEIRELQAVNVSPPSTPAS